MNPGLASPFFNAICHDTASEIYVGCSNGELVRFAPQAHDPNIVRLILRIPESVH